jgi:hypothetical protein
MQNLGASRRALDLYVSVMRILIEADVSFLVGGSHSLSHTVAVERQSKDFDILLKPANRDRALAAFSDRGYPTEVTSPHWLAKVFDRGPEPAPFVDLIYRFGNGLAEVDDEWFAHAIEAEVLGLKARLVPPEEHIWSKAFVMERERFDGADVAHLIHQAGPSLDWDRLLQRFGAHWRVLLAHLILFGFIYPSERARVPERIVRALVDRLLAELSAPALADRICQGTLLSRAQYFTDIQQGGYSDPRLEPRGTMTANDVALWTVAIAAEHACCGDFLEKSQPPKVGAGLGLVPP